MTLSARDVLGSPDYHLFAFEGADAIFLRMDQAAYRRSIFLDGRIAPADARPIRVPTAGIMRAFADHRAAPPSAHWIFHVANCGSTLLARALDFASGALVLREPMALRQLAVASQQGKTPTWREQIDFARAMAVRRYDPARTTVIKANVPVNFVLGDVLGSSAKSPAILLYYSLTDYLLALLRSDNHRAWVMRVTTEMSSAISAVVGDISTLDAPRRVAALWVAQMRLFDDTLAHNPTAHSLDAAMLMNSPRAAIDAAAKLFDVPMPDATLDAMLAGPLFATYSKNPAVRFDNAARIARQAEVAKAVAPDIAAAIDWTAGNSAAARLPERLARPLAGAAPKLLA